MFFKISIISVMVWVAWVGPLCSIIFSTDPFATPASASTRVPPLYPHERAYLEADIILIATITGFDEAQDIRVRVMRAVRGRVDPGNELILEGTRAFPFLHSPGALLTVFLKEIKQSRGILWAGPTSGGMIWNNEDTVDDIAAAFVDPLAVIMSGSPRSQLAAAYYLSTRGPLEKREKSQVISRLIWGLNHEVPEANQAALDALAALSIDVQEITGGYHPWFKTEIKRAAAERFSAWWRVEASQPRKR